MVTRRTFLRFITLGAASTAVALVGCRPVTQLAAQASLVPTLTRSPTETPVPRRSRLVRTRCDGVWNGEELSGEKLSQMLDHSVASLTGIQDALQAWKSLFKPGEKVAIKVNAILHGAVHPPLAAALVQRLQDCGIAPESVRIYDRTSDELEASGFALNRSGKGLRCCGTDGDYADAGEVAGMPARLDRGLIDCDALINLCILKGFTLGGISFALKNHYGSIENPGRFHQEWFARGISGLNALPQIQSRTRLVIGDLLTPQTGADFTSYVVLGEQNSIWMSRDPLAMDAVGLATISQALEASKGLDTQAMQVQAKEWLSAAQKLNLGASDREQIELQEVNI